MGSLFVLKRSLLQRKGHLLAGYMCTHVPEEILYAAGIVPVRILSSHVSQAMTRSYMHETYCSFHMIAHTRDWRTIMIS
jgi:benzoyl-CoA reductase subunit C